MYLTKSDNVRVYTVNLGMKFCSGVKKPKDSNFNLGIFFIISLKYLEK
jgi:hypothetical protein